MRTIKDILKETFKNLKPHEVEKWKTKIKPQKEKYKLIKNKEKKDENNNKLSEWEIRILFKLKKSKIKFSKKFRKFPLKIDDDLIYFTPDFRLDFPYKKRQHVIIEVHEKLEESDVKKFRTFMDVYGRIYWLIIVTKWEELSKWNKFDGEEQSLFHDIWSLDDVKDLISTLERLRTKDKGNKKDETTECPKCGKLAEGKFEIESLFGYRYEGKKPQSQCKVCRSNKGNKNFIPEQFGNPSHVNCPGCGEEFLEKTRGQSFCEKCLKEYYN